MKTILLSTYELGRQPFGLASPAAWLRRAGHDVQTIDLAVATLPSLEVREAGLVAFFLPMHTATRLAAQAIKKVRLLNPTVPVACYGLYAPLNEEYLRELGVSFLFGGEFEAPLVDLANHLAQGRNPAAHNLVSLDRLQFLAPDRSLLPPLARYARLHVNGSRKIVGYTEASRGCKHLCRHCPVVPVYQGAFRVVQEEVVLADIRSQVAAGAEHITFGDPDFFNGPTHAIRIVEALHREFPSLSYDATIKIEHLRKHRRLLPRLRETGCLFVTSAVESVDDAVLEKLRKNHTRADFVGVASDFRKTGLALAPTFIPFTPWTTAACYRDLLALLCELNLVDAVSPVQLALRLLIPNGSPLLELEDIRKAVTGFDREGLLHRWKHEDDSVDRLATAILRLVNEEQRWKSTRRQIFRKIWELAHKGRPPENYDLVARAAIPYMDEPWYC